MRDRGALIVALCGLAGLAMMLRRSIRARDIQLEEIYMEASRARRTALQARNVALKIDIGIERIRDAVDA